MTAVSLSSPRLRLRPASPGDADLLHTHWNRREVRRFLWDDEAVAAEAVRQALAQSDADFAAAGFGIWILESSGEVGGASGDGTFVGFCGLRVVEDTDMIELLYSIEPESWGNGLATEAAAAVLDHAFGALRLPRVVGGIDPPNAASRRVLERLGMTYFDTLTLNGLPADYYELTAAGRPASST